MNRQVLLGVAIGFIGATLLFALLRGGGSGSPRTPEANPALLLPVEGRTRLEPLGPDVRPHERYRGVGRTLAAAPDAG